MTLHLQGHLVLIAEDQALIALDIRDAVRNAGASALVAATLKDGLRFAEHPQLSAAVLDVALGADDCSPLCERLSERRIPFVISTGYSAIPASCAEGVVISKPALPSTLVAALARMLR